jgi:hypothetical protein
VRRELGGLASTDDLLTALRGSVASCVCVYAVLFGTGHLLMGHTGSAVAALMVGVASGTVMARAMGRAWRA